MAHWLRLCTTNAGCPGLILGQGTRFHMPQLRPSTAKKKNKSQTEVILEEDNLINCQLFRKAVYQIANSPLRSSIYSPTRVTWGLRRCWGSEKRWVSIFCSSEYPSVLPSTSEIPESCLQLITSSTHLVWKLCSVASTQSV